MTTNWSSPRIASPRRWPLPAVPSGGRYRAQLTEAAGLVAAELGYRRRWHLGYSSRSGPPSQPWLEPDINDLLGTLAAAGSRAVVVVPVGFVSDHMEVKFDLDVEAAQTAERLGLAFARAATPGTDARFVSMITDLVCERTDGRARDADAARSRWARSGPAQIAARPAAAAPGWPRPRPAG